MIQQPPQQQELVNSVEDEEELKTSRKRERRNKKERENEKSQATANSRATENSKTTNNSKKRELSDFSKPNKPRKAKKDWKIKDFKKKKSTCAIL